MLLDYDIYVDSDGVVVDFDLYCLIHFGCTAAEFKNKGAFWAKVMEHDTKVQPFFRHMPKCAGADELLDFCVKNARSTKILTACGYTPANAAQQKIDYYGEHYPHLTCITVPKSPDKAVYAGPNAILIDDRQKSIDPWIAAGGIGILHSSVENTIAQLSAL